MAHREWHLGSSSGADTSGKYLPKDSTILTWIFRKTWCPCKAKVLCILKVLVDQFVHSLPNCPVAFIDDEYNPVFPVAVDHLMLRFDGIGHLLNSRQNQRFRPVSHLFQKFVSIVSHVHRVRFKLVELRQSLGVQILSCQPEKTFSMLSSWAMIWLALNEVSVFPLPVVCQMYPLFFVSNACRTSASTA